MRAFTQKRMRYLILAAAAASLVYGLARGEAADVFRKAATICMECIGIG